MSAGYRKMQRPTEAREMALEAAQRFKQAGRRLGSSVLIAGRGDTRRCRIRFDWGRANGNIARNLFIEAGDRSEEHTSELQSLMRISYAVFCLKKKTKQMKRTRT